MHSSKQNERPGAGQRKRLRPLPLVLCVGDSYNTRHHTSGGVTTAAASSAGTATASAPDEVVEVFEFQGKEYIRADLAEQMSVPKGKAGRAEKKKLHQELYGKQVDEEGKFHPGPHAKYDASCIQRQIACEHPCDELLWNGNKSGLLAKCSLCKLKSVIEYKVFDASRFRLCLNSDLYPFFVASN